MPETETLDRLSALLRRGSTNTRTCVPVFGTGLNIQAAIAAGYEHRDDWAELLAKIGARIGITREQLALLPRGNLARWEALLVGWARSLQVYPFQAEAQLQALVCDELRAQEEECRGFDFYRTIATAGFEDIISLNFDRRIAQGVGKNTFDYGPRPTPHGPHGESLYRHSVLPLATGVTARVWYPHGDVKKADTIKLGVRKYGFYIGVLQEYLQGLGDSWRYKPNSRQRAAEETRGQERVRAAGTESAPTWVRLLLERPVVFVGCGLSADEWPLWSMLRRRATTGREPTYFLGLRGKAGVPPHFQLLPAMDVVLFDSPAELWEFFNGCLAA